MTTEDLMQKKMDAQAEVVFAAFKALAEIEMARIRLASSNAPNSEYKKTTESVKKAKDDVARQLSQYSSLSHSHATAREIEAQVSGRDA